MPPQKGAKYNTDQRHLREVDGVKPCATCEELKPLAEFHKNAAKASGLDSDCKSCKAAYFRRSGHNERVRARKFVVRYGITLTERDALAASQGGRCAICDKIPARPLHVDHCHARGRVRGMLCHQCNVLLGSAKDDPEILHAALRYLERNRQ